MKKRYWGIFFPYTSILLLLFFFKSEFIQSQCASYTANTHCTTAAPTVIGNSISCTPPNNNGGRRNFLVTNMIAGNIYRISNCGSGFDTQITVFNNIGTISLAYNDDDGPACAGTAASIDFTVPYSGDFRIQLNRWNCSTTNQLNGTITVTLQGFAPQPPANDICINATSLPCGTIGLTGTTTNTSNLNHGSGCLMSNYGVWYTFVGDGSTTTVTSTANFDHEMSISRGSCGSLINVSCHDDTWSPGTETASFPTINGQTYYVYISDWLSGSTTTGNFTISRTCSAPCSPGNGTGIASLGCPSVLAGGLGLSGVDPDPVNCDEMSGCVTIEAEYLQLGTTANYDVESIPYTPPYQFNCLQNPVSVNIDDVWSPIVNLPFNFCFYGNSYNSCVIASNGVISFDTSLANSQSGYEINFNLPSLINAQSINGIPFFYGPSIHGVHHDIDPSIGGEVAWELITLNTGCRALVAGWSDVPMFNDNSILYSGMIVLYEDTNVIEVYIKEKNIDAYSPYYNDAWNYGNAIVGIQNATGNQAVVAPGRNSLSPNWSTTNEAWRFTPSGPSITTIQWFEGATVTGPVIGTTDTISVCPTTTTTYTAQVTYTLCNGTILNEIDQTTVTVTVDKT